MVMRQLVLALSCIAVFTSATTAQPENLLGNGSFELGQGQPYGWSQYGGGGQGWESGGPDGAWCVAVVGDGNRRDVSGWCAGAGARPDRNRTYHASVLVRREGGTRGFVTMGLNRAKWAIEANSTWRRVAYDFRSPDFQSGVRFELGQMALDGIVYFDSAGLYPVEAVHRARGRSRLVLGDGESVVERRYTAVHELGGRHTNDCRFLRRYTADFEENCWVLDKHDVVDYCHQIEVAGAPELDPGVLDPYGLVAGGVTSSDPDAMRLVVQEGAKIEVEVPVCQGTLYVQGSRRPDGPWQVIGTITNPGTHTFTVPKQLLPTRTLAVQLASGNAQRIEVTKYQFSSHLIQQIWREPVYGTSAYLAVVQDTPDLAYHVLDAGDLIFGGRDEATLMLTNKGPRRRIVAAVVIQKAGALVSREEREFWMATGSQRLCQIPYHVAPQGDQIFTLIVRDAQTSEILLDMVTAFP